MTCSQSGGGPPWARTYTCNEGGDDDHYHGTHVAGTIGAIDNGEGVVGVAPGARIWAVKVLNSNGSGTEAQVVAGIDWVAANANTIEVANMSLGGNGFSQAEYDAIQGAVDAGVAFAVAAGNSDDDANNHSPAAFDNVLTASALADFDGEPGGNGSPTCRADQDDTLADFSNWGNAVQIAVPGVCILSTYPIEQGSYGTISGTSMASPHAAGALALLASSNNPGNATDVFNLYDQVINTGNSNWVDDSGDGIQEPLLDVSNTTVFAPATVAGDGAPPPSDTTEPAAPTGLVATAGDTTVGLDWADNAEADLASYKVYRSTTSGVSYTEVATTTVSNYTDNGLTNGTIYYYVVTALDTSGNESLVSAEASATPQAGATTTVHAGDLAGVSKVKGRSGKWEVTVTVTVHDATDGLVAGATVTGTWTGAAGGPISGVTGADGTVTLSTGNLTTGTEVTFAVDNVTGDSLTYDAGSNHDDPNDGDNSDGNSITVLK